MILDYNSLPFWIYPLLIWTLTWKAIAIWKAARKGHLTWFIIFLAINTLGFLPILYLTLLKDIKFYSIDDIKKKQTQKKQKSKTKKSKPKKIPTLE